VKEHLFETMIFSLATVFISAVVAGGCQSEPAAPQLPVGYQMPVMAPVVAPVPEPVAPPVPEPPPTPLIPIVEETPAAQPGKAAAGTGICKNIPGIATNGDEIVGNYMCKLDTNDLPMGITPPPFACALRKQGDDSVRIMPSGTAASLSGPVTETKAAGFRLDGTWSFMNNKLRIGACMMRKGAGKFVGSGSGILNDKKDKKIKFTLTMTKQ
jgi:hypothetical protein